VFREIFEAALDPLSSVTLPLHAALKRNLDVAFTEIRDVSKLARDCGEDARGTFLYVAAPLKFVNGSGAPVNLVVIQ
jgi:hypothetical protein